MVAKFEPNFYVTRPVHKALGTRLNKSHPSPTLKIFSPILTFCLLTEVPQQIAWLCEDHSKGLRKQAQSRSMMKLTPTKLCTSTIKNRKLLF